MTSFVCFADFVSGIEVRERDFCHEYKTWLLKERTTFSYFFGYEAADCYAMPAVVYKFF